MPFPPIGAARLALGRLMPMALALVLLAATSTPLWASSQDATQRLLAIKARQDAAAQAKQGGLPASSLSAAQPAAQASNQPDSVVVTAKGVASFYPNDAARSRNEAIEAAQRDAVQQASGIIISSESEMRNFNLVSDSVLSRSKGFIRHFDVVKEGRDGLFYDVTIRATVVKKAFIQDFQDALAALYRRVGKPRIMLLVKEDDRLPGEETAQDAKTSDSESLGVVEREIRKILLKDGFTFVDAGALTKGSLVQKAFEGRGTNSSVLDAARTVKAELVMLGRGRIGAKNMLQQFNIVNATVGLDVVRTDNGQVLASDVANGKALNINADVAAVEALKKAADTLTPQIMQQVTYQWLKDKNEGARIELVVKNASFGDLLALRRDLANTVKGVSKVRQKSYNSGTALLELESKDTADRLAESMYEQDFGSYKLDIQDVTGNTITVSVVKPKQK